MLAIFVIEISALLIDEISLKSNLSYDRRKDLVVGYEDLGGDCERKSTMAKTSLVFMIRGLALN